MSPLEKNDVWDFIMKFNIIQTCSSFNESLEHTDTDFKVYVVMLTSLI